MGQNLKLVQPWWNFIAAKSKKKKKNPVWKLTTEQSGGPWRQDLWLHSILGDREQGKCVLRGKKEFLRPPASLCPWLFAGLQTELSRQPPVLLLLGSSNSPSDHLPWKQSQWRQHLTALVQDSDASCLLPREPELKDFGWLCLQLCLESSQSTSKCSVLVMGWAAGLNFTGEVSYLSSTTSSFDDRKSRMGSESTDLWLQKLVFCNGFHKAKDKFVYYTCFTVHVLCFCLLWLKKEEKLSPCSLHICRVCRVSKSCGFPKFISLAQRPS